MEMGEVHESMLELGRDSGAVAPLNAWQCVRSETRRILGRDDLTPGMITGIQTHGEVLHWHPHLHVLVTCGAFTPTGEFLPLPAFDVDALHVSTSCRAATTTAKRLRFVLRKAVWARLASPPAMLPPWGNQISYQ